MMKYALAVLAALVSLSCSGPLNSTQQTYAAIGLDTASCVATCGVQAGKGAIEGTVNGDAALACLTRCATSQGLKVIAELVEDVLTGVTGGGWFGSATEAPKHNPVYRVRLVKTVP